MDLVEKFEKAQISKLTSGKEIPSFKAGDTVKVSVRIFDKNVERQQDFQGIVLARRSAGVNSSFLVREMNGIYGVEKRFMLYSPVIKNIEVIKRGVVRRSKIYYLRELRGKAAKIREKMVYKSL